MNLEWRKKNSEEIMKEVCSVEDGKHMITSSWTLARPWGSCGGSRQSADTPAAPIPTSPISPPPPLPLHVSNFLLYTYYHATITTMFLASIMSTCVRNCNDLFLLPPHLPHVMVGLALCRQIPATATITTANIRMSVNEYMKNNYWSW